MLSDLAKEGSETIKVLVVDDDVVDYTLFSKKIANSNYINIHLDHCDTYKTAKTEILQSAHDIYFIDYTLGAQSGLDLIEDMTSEGHKGPFILLTGMDRPDLYRRSSETGVYDYLLKKELNESQILRTITYTLERCRIEKTLNKERLFSDMIVKEVPFMMMSLDSAGIIQSTNPRVKHVTDYDDQDIIGKPWADFIDDLDANVFTEITNNQNTMSLINIMICKNGIKKNIEWTMLHNTWRDGMVSIMGKDITEELEIEERRRQDEKMKALGHLAGGVAHEINNLLQPILLNAEWIKTSDDIKEINSVADSIIETTEIASSIVEDVLIFARKDNGTLEKLEFLNNFNKALNIAREMISDDIHIIVHNTSIHDNFQCLFRLKDLVRVLSNLIKNAAYAMNGQGDIDIHMNEITHDEVSFIEVSVKDNGFGIDAAILNNIFNPFYTTKDVGEGTGLGLTMVYNIVDNWGGQVIVKSEKAEETEFIFTIPICDE